MMKYGTAILVMASVLIVGGANPVLAQEQRFAFIDMDRVFNEFYKTQLADAQLQERAEEFNEERRRMIAEYEELQESFSVAREDAQSTALSEEVRRQRRSEAEEKLIELREMETRIQSFDESRRKQLEDQGQRMRNRLVNEIQDVIRNYAKAEGYHVVIDSSGQSLNAIELILYVDEETDISEPVIETLNRRR